jgi:DNA repair protein RadC
MAHRLYQHVRAEGVRAASLIDLVAIAISRTADDVDPNESLARQILKDYGQFRALSQAASKDFQEVSGFDDFEALKLLASIEIGRRSAMSGKGPVQSISGPEDVATLLERFKDEKQERFMMVLLDAKNNVLREATIHVGTATMSIVSPRDVFRVAIRDGATAIIVAHNHPSGDPTPSADDLAVTERLVEAGRLLDIPVLDHVIIGDGHTPDRLYVSLKRRGVSFE